MANQKIDIGNVRGVKGDRGEQGERGKTPSYNDLKYVKVNEEFIKLLGTGSIGLYYLDVNGNICDAEGHILDENRNPTNIIGEPFNENEYGYRYKPIYLDSLGQITNEDGELLDENGNVKYVETSFINDIIASIYKDKNAYNKLVNDIFPKIIDDILNADPHDELYANFFAEIEGDIKYYICLDNPKNSIYNDNNNNLVNECRYLDDDGYLAVDGDNRAKTVPLEKNALYLYNGSGYTDNNIMHYDIYLCKKANTIPIKLVSSADFQVNYNVIDELKLTASNYDNLDESKYDVLLEIITRGTRGQFYSMSDVDKLFDNNVIKKLGANYGIAQLNGNGKVLSSQLPAYIDDIVEGTMNSAETVFTPSDETYIDSVTQKGKIYVDTNTRKTYRWTGNSYIFISNPIIVDDGSSEAYASASGILLENKIGSNTLTTNNKIIIDAINELNSNKVDKVNGKGLSTEDYTTLEKEKLLNIEVEANKTEIVDNLTTNDNKKALSAKQGKILNEKIGMIVDFFNGTG